MYRRHHFLMPNTLDMYDISASSMPFPMHAEMASLTQK